MSNVSIGLRQENNSRTSNHFCYLAWKEWRQNLPILMVFTLTYLLTVSITLWLWDSKILYDDRFPQIAILLGSVLSLAIGISLFAPEKEHRTVEWLGGLPVSQWGLVKTKLIMGLVTVGIFFLIGALVSFVIWMMGGSVHYWAGSIERVETSLLGYLWYASPQIASSLMLPLECFVWAAVCSLMIPRTIFAVFLAAAGVLLVAGASQIIVPEVFFFATGVNSTGIVSDATALGLTLSFRIIALVSVVVAIGMRGRVWLRSISSSVGTRGSKNKAARDYVPGWVLGYVTARSSARRSPGGAFISLVWQSFRQSYLVFLLAIPVYVVLAFSFLGGPAYLDKVWVVYLVSVGFALFTFASDQYRNRFLFFQQQGEHPRKLWLARLLPIGLVLLPAVGILLYVFTHASIVQVIRQPSVVARLSGEQWLVSQMSPMAVFVIVVTAFSVGQFCSMLVRSTILSIGFAAFVAPAAFGWLALVIWLDVGLIFAWVLPIALFSATFLTSSHWLASRSFGQRVLVPICAIGFLLMITCCGVAAVRWTQIPPTNVIAFEDRIEIYDALKTGDLELAAKQLEYSVKSEGLEPSRLYIKAMSEYEKVFKIARLPNGKYDNRLLTEANENAFPLLRIARLYCQDNPFIISPYPIFDPETGIHNSRFRNLRNALGVVTEDQLRAGNNPDVTLEYLFDTLALDDFAAVNSNRFQLIDWSRMENQTPGLLESASRQLASWNLVRHEILMQSSIISVQQKHAWLANHNFDSVGQTGFKLHWLSYFPWEIERSERVALHLAKHDNYLISQLKEISDIPKISSRAWTERHHVRTFTDIEIQLRNAHPYLAKARTNILPPSSAFSSNGELYKTQEWRYLIVRLALEAFRLKQGAYPETLSELVPDYVAEIPVDVREGGEFFYAPKGMSHKVFWETMSSRELMTRTTAREHIPTAAGIIEAGVPFLLPWSTNHSGRVLTSFLDPSGVDENDTGDSLGFDLSSLDGLYDGYHYGKYFELNSAFEGEDKSKNGSQSGNEE